MDLNTPAPHVSHDAAVRPSAELKVPAVLHENPWQVVDWGTLLNEAGQQSVQTVAPVPATYLPAEQDWHDPDDGAPTVPENVPAPQAMHTPDMDAPEVTE